MKLLTVLYATPSNTDQFLDGIIKLSQSISIMSYNKNDLDSKIKLSVSINITKTA